MEAKCRLLLVDGHAFAYRAFHAIRSLASPVGRPTGAIFGFIKMLGKMQGQLAPSHGAVIWDGGLAAERLAQLPGYKSERPPMPADLGAQIEEIQSYLAAAGVSSWSRDGVEADDALATLARQAEREGLPVVIASSDKDFMQLVCPGIGLLNPNDKVERVWAAEEVRAKTGVTPEQVIDWLSLMGDTVDDIPGVPGVGAKTAAELLNRFGSVSSLYMRLEEVNQERIRAALGASFETVVRNQKLIKLNDKVDLGIDLEDLRLKKVDTVRLRELYSGWGFRSLLAQLNETPLLF